MKNKCDTCSKRDIVKNIQLTWVIWDVDKKGDYSEEHELDDSEPIENYHLCDKCFTQWEDGKLIL